MTQFKATSVAIGCGIIALSLAVFDGIGVAQSSSPTIPLSPGRVPEQILEQTAPFVPKEPSKEDNTESKSDQINKVINFAIGTTSVRYPWLTNPTDRLTFTPTIFNPSQNESYFDTDIRFASQNPTLVKITYGYFPTSNQFYWVLPNNRVVIETQGIQGGIIQQGQGTDTVVQQSITFSRALIGNQIVVSLPEVFQEITNNLDTTKFTIQTTSGLVVNPLGIPAPPVTISSGINFNSPNVTVITIGSGSTNNPQGGLSNFGNLEAQNTPQVLQALPTVNLQPLFDNAAIPLAKDAIVSEQGLSSLGLSFNTGNTSSSLLGGLTSFPGIKILQVNKFDNPDLLEILTNPSLSKSEREFYYLNSLFWSDLGERTPQIVSQITRTNSNWQRIYASLPVNQSLITYDSKDIKATYNNRFINLGASISYSFDTGKINFPQSINNTLGMLLGSAFLAIDPQGIQAGVNEGKRLRDEQAKFTPLSTVATSEQRQQINQRLNNSLFYSSISSALEQVSGNLTFDSNITPTHSEIIQVRTGLYRRVVQFLDSSIESTQGDTIVSNLRTSFENFGPLTFLGTLIPKNETGFQPNETGFQPNESFASEIVLTDPSSGRQLVQSFNSADPNLTTIPTGIRRFVLAFDRLELTRKDRQRGKFSTYQGSVSLPSVEATWSGSQDNFNYSVSSGLWFNFAKNTAGNVANNNLGTTEPSIGAFINAFLIWRTSSVENDSSGRVTTVTTQSPIVRLSWNSSTNQNNSSFISFSYTLSQQMQGMGFTVTPGILLADQSTSLRTISFLQGSLEIGNGLRFRSSLEYDQNLYWSLEATQLISSSYTLGIFIKNFKDTNQGIESRILESIYGMLIRYQIPQTPASIEAQLGSRSDGIDFRIKGNLRF